MVFAFNFGANVADNIQEEEEIHGAQKTSGITWRKAEEIFLEDSHLCALAKLPSYEQFDLDG